MKKTILLAAVALGAITAQAQQVVEAPKFFDNWSVSLVGGATNSIEGNAFWGDMRGVVGIEIEKQVTPILALGVEGNWGINTSYGVGHNVFDDQYAGVYGAINLNKLFGACKCKTQLFEVEAVAGAGWGRTYDCNWSMDHNNWYTADSRTYTGFDHNFFATKAGLNFNFNVCDKVTVSFKPSMVWNMSDSHQWNTSASYDSHKARLNLMAGVTYHIGGKGFNCVRPYDQAEIDALNAQINDLRQQNEACNANLDAAKNHAARLQKELDDCNKKLREKPAQVVQTVVEHQTQLNNIVSVFFNKASSAIKADQKPNVEMVANYLKSNPEATVEIRGYASPEGSVEINQELSEARAQSVKNMLVKTYGIDSDRIVNAAGYGVGTIFEEPTWNRVSICILDK